MIEIYQWEIEDLEEEISKAGTAWKGYRLPDSKKERRILISEVLKYIYKSDDVENFEKESIETKKVLRRNQRHKDECREVAKALWRSNSKLTVPQIAKRNEIINACEGKKYTVKTIREWIKDLNPNQLPGRRKGT